MMVHGILACELNCFFLFVLRKSKISRGKFGRKKEEEERQKVFRLLEISTLSISCQADMGARLSA